MASVNRLSKSAIRNLPEGWHSDGNNLYLRVINDERYWVLRKMRKGTRVVKSLGKFPYISLADARKRALEEVYGNPELFVKQRKYPKLKDVWEEAVDHLATVRKWKSGASRTIYQSHYKRFIGPALGEKRTDCITTKDVFNMLSPHWEESSVYMENVRNSLCCVYKALLVMDKAKGQNPAVWKGNLDALLPLPSRKTHFKAANKEDLAKLFSTNAASSEHAAICFGTLTALRAKEFLWATWDEVDLETATLSICPKRRKDKKVEPFRVPLSKQAVALLQAIPRTSKYVFVSSRGCKLHSNSISYWFRTHGFDFTMHGMRSVFMDWGTERSKDPILLEKCLCHATGGAVTQAYQRSDCLEQRRPIMQEWADYLYSLAQNS